MGYRVLMDDVVPVTSVVEVVDVEVVVDSHGGHGPPQSISVSP